MTRVGWLRHLFAQVALWCAALLLVNHLAAAAFVRVDLTKDQRHLLSDAAIDAVSGLERPLLARVYYTRGLKAPYHDHRDALLEKLTAMAAWSGGRMEIHEVDPSEDKALAEEASRFGISPVTYVYSDWEGRETKLVYMGVSFVYGDEQRAVSALPSLAGMEYELVRALRAVTTPAEDRKTLGIAVGFGMPDLFSYAPDTPVAAVVRELVERFHLRRVDLTSPIPEDVDGLLVAGPQEPVSATTLGVLDEFVQRGGRALWFVSTVQPDYANGRTRTVDHGLTDLLRSYGAELRPRALVDRSHCEETPVPVEIDGQRGIVRAKNPLVPVTSVLFRDYPAVRDLERLVLPFATPVRPVDTPVQVDVWARPGPGASTAPLPVAMDLRRLQAAIEGEDAASDPVVLALSGRFPAFFPDAASSSQAPSRMVVVGSLDALTNNPAFVLNALDWALEDEALVSIRTRGVGFDRLPQPEHPWRMRLAIVSLPLLGLVLLTAVFRRVA